MTTYSSEIERILNQATSLIQNLDGQVLDVLAVSKPPDLEYARHLAQVISKLSPLIGNMLEYAIVSELNKQDWSAYRGTWARRDPGFPDTVFNWNQPIKPGVEVKTWFPLATEMTARFRDSQIHFVEEQTRVAIVAWLPEYLLYGKPKLVGVFTCTASSLAKARDAHYHNPPDYIILEPEDTRNRTANLQQTNVIGYKFQGTPKQLRQAQRQVARWGGRGTEYSYSPDYQKQLKQLLSQYPYRIDTNFSKIDRIRHSELETFKAKTLRMEFFGFTIEAWAKQRLRTNEGLNQLLQIKRRLR
ncbi:MAG: hypothetical protein HY741_18165 [Chloroflexi bacterium]|nr:hypothetical protein [Chloroflexota bacterium]